MVCDRFAIVVVPFPFVDSARTKPRPAPVLSIGDLNRANQHTVLAMITRARAVAQRLADRGFAIDRPARSVVRFKIFTLDNRILQRRIGQLGAQDSRGCAAVLETILHR